MKSAVRLFVAVLALTALSTAPAAAQGWALGFEGGLNVSDLSIDPDAETDSELGLRAGGVIRYHFAPEGVFSVQTGATYSRKGAADQDADSNLDYLEVPLLLVVTIPTDGATVHPRLYGGGSFNFELSCDLSPADGDGESVDCGDGDVFGRESFDFGVRVGGGLDIDVAANAAVTIDAGYDLGLTDIATAEDTEIKNRNLFVTGGFIFHP